MKSLVLAPFLFTIFLTSFVMAGSSAPNQFTNDKNCKKFYPFLTDMPALPTSTRLNFDLFDEIYSTSMRDTVSHINCPDTSIGGFTCFSGHTLSDGTLLFTGYSNQEFTGDLDDLAIKIDVHGIPAKLAPIPLENGMLNIGYRNPNIDREIALVVFMPKSIEPDYSTIGPLYPLLLRVFEAHICVE